jgi:hypothetical protein
MLKDWQSTYYQLQPGACPYIITTDAFKKNRLEFAVAEFLDIDPSQGVTKALRDFLG